MPRLSTLSNPTGLVEIEKQRLTIVLDEDKSQLSFSLARLDLVDLKLPSPLNVVVIARRGNTEERVELGAVHSYDKGFRRLTEIATEGTWTFRVLLVDPSSPRLIAAAENIRPDGQGESSAFIALESADLGERTWEVEIMHLEGRAVIKFNQRLFASSGEAGNDFLFLSLVLPEAIRQLAGWVAENSALEDKEWEPMKAWLVMHGITEEPDPDNEDACNEWVKEVVAAFCNRFEFATKLAALKSKGYEE